MKTRGHFGGPPLFELPAVSSPRYVFVVTQKGVCFGPVRALFLAVSASLHLSHSMGFIFNDGGSDRAKRGPPPPPSSAPSNTLKETLRDVPSPFDNHSHFSFSPKFPFFPSPFPPSVLRAAGENIAAFNLTFLTDDLVNKQSGRKYLQKKYIFLCVCVLLFRL